MFFEQGGGGYLNNLNKIKLGSSKEFKIKLWINSYWLSIQSNNIPMGISCFHCKIVFKASYIVLSCSKISNFLFHIYYFKNIIFYHIWQLLCSIKFIEFYIWFLFVFFLFWILDNLFNPTWIKTNNKNNPCD